MGRKKLRPVGALTDRQQLRRVKDVYAVEGFGALNKQSVESLKSWVGQWNIPDEKGSIDPIFPHDYLFTNYWHAYAYSLKRKALQADAETA